MTRMNDMPALSPHSDKSVTWGDRWEKLCYIVGFLLKLAFGAFLIMCLGVGFHQIMTFVGDAACAVPTL